MILTRIRLHPFGATTDRDHELARPVAVLFGPNEAGKSTLREALHHALFTPTNETKGKTEAALGRWYPKPAGDHVAVTLVFEHEGREWTLLKRWGAGSASSLTATGTAAIGDADAVQNTIATFLGHNEATGRHVLSTGQAELTQTLAALAAARARNEVRSVTDVLAEAAGTSGGIGPERLREALSQRIDDCFSHWDRAGARPERDAQGRERGPKNPWAKQVGRVLEAWYAWQTACDELADLRHAEEQLDTVSAELTALEAQLAADKNFLATARPLRDGLAKRRVLETELRGSRVESVALTEIMTKWPASAAGVTAAKQKLDDLEAQKQTLVTEHGTATRRVEAENHATEFAALTRARQEWLDAVEAVGNSFAPPVEAVTELDQLAERIKDARNRIEAQKLAYEIAAREPLTVRIEEAAEPARELSVGDGLSGVARSRLCIEAGPLSVTITSGEEDVAPLFAALDRDVARERTLLEACRAESLVDVKAQVRRHADLVATAAFKKTAWEARLRGKSFEQWQEETAAFVNLPQTRDVAVLVGEIKRIDAAIGVENGTLRLHEANVRQWTEKYTTQQQLLESLVEIQTLIKSGEQTLGALPTVPAGFATPDDFLEALAKRESENQDLPERLKGLVSGQQALRDAVADRSATELAEEAERLEQAFLRVLREGRAYERILAVLDEVQGEQPADPLAGFTTRVTEWFRRITGGQDGLGFSSDMPTQVARGSVELPPDLLSQGGGAALALVLRLALAEVHLGEQPGFIVLDDPLVDLDAERRERAKDVLREFAARHQVIFITCHEPHAAGLGEPTVLTRP